MNWQQYWDDLAAQRHAHAQVARTGGKVPITDDLMDEVAVHISQHLSLQLKESLLDVCCGNGLLTQRLAHRCQEVLGIDLSHAQIELARQQHPAINTQYLWADATRLSHSLSGEFDKINLYFSFQYMDTLEKGRKALTEMHKLLKPGGKIFLGDVPDCQKLSVFFPSAFQQWKYRIQLMMGKSPMGKFWCEEEIRSLAEELSMKITAFDQPAHFPYAHYRRDYLLEKA